MSWYLEALKKYAVFGGRSRRREYWMFFLVNLMITVALTIADVAFGMFSLESGAGLLSTVYGLAVLIPGIAVSVRRLHDIGRSGWWLFIVLVPILGAIVLLVFAVLESEHGPNRYGPNPKQAGVEAGAAFA